MDAHLWHRQAVTPVEESPEPLSGERVEAMVRVDRLKYANAVRSALRRRAVGSPMHAHVVSEMTQALESALLEPPGARTILALSAPYAVGKSTLIKQWAHQLHRKWLGPHASDDPPRIARPGFAFDHYPIWYVSLLSNTKSKDLYAQLLGFAGYPTSGSEADLAVRTVLALRNHGARLVILDDAHMLRTSSVTGRTTLNAVKHLNTELGELGGVLMLVGAELTDGEALADPQIRGRLVAHSLAPYAIDTIEGRARWQQLLDACEDSVLRYLPANEAGVLAVHNAAYLWHRTQGYVGDTARLIIDATAYAITEMTPLDRGVLERIGTSQRAQDATVALGSNYRGDGRPRKRTG